MSYLTFIKKSFGFEIGTMWHDTFDKKDPFEFRATGSQIYHGRQRQGKTLGMVHGFHKLKRRYPKLLIVSNIRLKYVILHRYKTIWKFKFIVPYLHPFKGHDVKTEQELKEITNSKEFIDGTWQDDNYIYYQSYDSLLMLLKKCRGGGDRGKWGVCFQIDEIHQYFHSHDSKSMPVWVAQIFSQQMKQHILVVGTVQKWENVIKALREQIQHLILSTRHGWFIKQQVVDPEDFVNEYGEMLAPIKKTGRFFMSKIVRDSYDTLALIESGREIFGGGDTNTIIAVKEPEKAKRPFRGRKTARVS